MTGTSIVCFESSATGLHIRSSDIERGVGYYRGRRCATNYFNICQSHDEIGSWTLYWCKGDACCFSYYTNFSVAYTVPSIYLLYDVCSFWSSKKNPSHSSDTSLAFAIGHIWRPLSASRRLRCVRCEGVSLNHLAGQRWMWSIFWLTIRCWRDSRLLQLHISLLDPADAKAGLKYERWWHHVYQCKRFFYMFA